MSTLHALVSRRRANGRSCPVAVHAYQRTLAFGNRRATIRAWQDRVRDPSLTVLLVLELCLLFIAAPLAAKGLPMALAIAETLVLGVLALVVILSHRRGAIVLILIGLAATLASLGFGSDWPRLASSVLRCGGTILAFGALTWVVWRAVYAPGRIRFHRVQGAVVLYLNLATIFAAAFSLIWELSPTAFAHVQAPAGGPHELATMLYFSFTTLTTTGYGDIVPVDPLARSLASFEAVLGQFYVALTMVRLVTLRLDDWRG